MLQCTVRKGSVKFKSQHEWVGSPDVIYPKEKLMIAGVAYLEPASSHQHRRRRVKREIKSAAAREGPNYRRQTWSPGTCHIRQRTSQIVEKFWGVVGRERLAAGVKKRWCTAHSNSSRHDREGREGRREGRRRGKREEGRKAGDGGRQNRRGRMY